MRARWFLLSLWITLTSGPPSHGGAAEVQPGWGLLSCLPRPHARSTSRGLALVPFFESGRRYLTPPRNLVGSAPPRDVRVLGRSCWEVVGRRPCLCRHPALSLWRPDWHWFVACVSLRLDFSSEERSPRSSTPDSVHCSISEL